MTIDADSVMSPTMLVEIERMLASGRYIGGSSEIKMERTSFPLWLTEKLMKMVFFVTGLVSGGGLYWFFKTDFDAIGGFDEKLTAAEDMEFAARLKRYGRKQGKRFGIVRKAHIVFSCRKFDVFGDWAFLRTIFDPRVLIRASRGDTREVADRALYDFDNHAAARLRDAAGR